MPHPINFPAAHRKPSHQQTAKKLTRRRSVNENLCFFDGVLVLGFGLCRGLGLGIGVGGLGLGPCLGLGLGGLWRLLAAFGGLWWLLVASGGFWRLLLTSKG